MNNYRSEYGYNKHIIITNTTWQQRTWQQRTQHRIHYTYDSKCSDSAGPVTGCWVGVFGGQNA